MRKKKKMNRIKNNGLFWFTFLLLVCISFPVSASTDAKQGEVDVQDIVFSHIKDAYTWHITEWNGKEISIPLPIVELKYRRSWENTKPLAFIS